MKKEISKNQIIFVSIMGVIVLGMLFFTADLVDTCNMEFGCEERPCHIAVENNNVTTLNVTVDADYLCLRGFAV